MAENSKLKQRLVGAVVLVSIGIIFLPLVLQSPDELRLNVDDDVIPPKPPGLSVKVVPLNVPEIEESTESPVTDQSPATEGVEAVTPEAPSSAPDTTPAPDIPVAWVVQVGSFSDGDNARALRDKLLKRKYAAFVDEEVASDGGKTFRVRVGPELLRSRANAIRDDLEKQFKLKGIVVRHTVD